MTAAEPELFAAAVERVRRGGLVAYPTETLYGLGADARSADAVRRLQAWKGREATQPLSVLVAGVGGLVPLERLGLRVPPPARRLLEALWPGPLTVVLPCAGGRGGRDDGEDGQCGQSGQGGESGKGGTAGGFAPGVARPGDGAVGVRCSPHPVARGLARALEEAGAGPVTATSLNRHGERPVARRAEALALCGSGAEDGGARDGEVGDPAWPGGSAPGRAPLAAAEATELGLPWLLAPADAPEPAGTASTVVDATGAEPRVLREGAISRASVEAAWAGGPGSGQRRGAA